MVDPALITFGISSPRTGISKNVIGLDHMKNQVFPYQGRIWAQGRPCVNRMTKLCRVTFILSENGDGCTGYVRIKKKKSGIGSVTKDGFELEYNLTFWIVYDARLD